MAVKAQMCEKQFAEWCTNFPRVGKSCESPSFSLESQDWYFRLATEYSDSADTEIWSMRFKKTNSREMPASFLLIVYVKGKTKDLYVAHKTINGYDTEIWSLSHNSFFSRLPQVIIVGAKATFVFSIDYAIRDKEFQVIEREHKSVQTFIPPAYLDDRHCLENLSLDLSKLMNDVSDPDVQLRCGDCTFPAHKLILSARSEVFRTMLNTDMQEGREGSVEIVDMEPKVFEIFIKYLYAGTLPKLTESIASPLYEAADKYHVEALKRRSGDFLAENLTREDACGILAIADAHNDKNLKDRVVSYILDEKIPNNDEEWLKFCDAQPKLANEILNRAYKHSNSSQ